MTEDTNVTSDRLYVQLFEICSWLMIYILVIKIDSYIYTYIYSKMLILNDGNDVYSVEYRYIFIYIIKTNDVVWKKLHFFFSFFFFFN